MAKFYFFLEWPEIIAVILLVIGFLLSLFVPSAAVSYLILFFCGAMFGKLWYRQRKSLRFKYFMIILGFLLGYLLGSSVIRYGSKGVMIIFFVLGWMLAYYLHKRGILFSKDF